MHVVKNDTRAGQQRRRLQGVCAKRLERGAISLLACKEEEHQCLTSGTDLSEAGVCDSYTSRRTDSIITSGMGRGWHSDNTLVRQRRERESRNIELDGGK